MAEDYQKVQSIVDTFHTNFESIVLATITEDGHPYTSYAPFVKVDNKLYLLISKIAKHYTNLTNHPEASVLLIDDEAKTKNIFFRKRLSYFVHTSIGEPTEEITQAYIHQFGEFAAQLFQMDFVVVTCTIQYGNVIVGPGKAYKLDLNNQVQIQMTGQGGHGHTR